MTTTKRDGKPGGALQQASDKQLKDIAFMAYALAQILAQTGHAPGLKMQLGMLCNEAQNVANTRDIPARTVQQFRAELDEANT